MQLFRISIVILMFFSVGCELTDLFTNNNPADEEPIENPTPPVIVSYTEPSASYSYGVTIAPNVPTIETSVPITSYSIKPELPGGLAFDTVNGEISGTPVDVSSNAHYTVTATSANGTAAYILAISVAATFVVDTNTDESDSDAGDGNCDNGSGQCTLRAAIEESNVLPDKQYLQVQEMEIVLTGSELTISDSVEIVGETRSDTVIDANFGSRVFLFNSGESRISTLTIENGSSPSNGGCILVSDSGLEIEDSDIKTCAATGSANGGALAIAGGTSNVSVTSSLFESNSTDTTTTTRGGAIHVGTNSLLSVADSTFVSNTSAQGSAVFYGSYVGLSGPATIRSSLIKENHNTGPLSGASIFASRSLDLTNSIIAKNTSDAYTSGLIVFDETSSVVHSNIMENETAFDVASGVWNYGGNLYVKASVLADNLRNTAGASFIDNCDGSVSSFGYNVVNNADLGASEHLECENGPGGQNLETNLNETDPEVEDLAENGGPIETYLPSPLSNLREAADPSSLNCPLVDARGFSRPVGVCDIGAVEAQSDE